MARGLPLDLLATFVPAAIMARSYPKCVVRPQLSRVELTLLAYVDPGWTEGSGLIRADGVGTIAGAAAWSVASLKQGPTAVS